MLKLQHVLKWDVYVIKTFCFWLLKPDIQTNLYNYSLHLTYKSILRLKCVGYLTYRKKEQLRSSPLWPIFSIKEAASSLRWVSSWDNLFWDRASTLAIYVKCLTEILCILKPSLYLEGCLTSRNRWHPLHYETWPN